MIDIKKLRENPGFYKTTAQEKGIVIDAEKILTLDTQVRALSSDIEAIRAKKNAVSAQMPKASPDERARLIEEMRAEDKEYEELVAKLRPLEEELTELLYRIPNPALADVKRGESDAENEVVREVGTAPTFDFPVKDHLELGEALDIIDTERGARTAGARFAYLKGDGALMQFALYQYALGIITKHGFIPTTVPHMVSPRVMRAMGYLEHGGQDEIYYLQKDNLYLIGTAEQPLGALHMDEVLKEEELPLRYVGISPCYRREAGSYGKDTKGIIRMHQFDKIEMFSYTTPETSDVEHEKLLAIEEELVQGLGLAYRVIKQCTGDLGMPAARKFDIETWIPSQNTYRETHSTSTCTDYQARRLNTRVKRTQGGTEFLHTLNGTAFAIGRIMVAIMEQYQQADGTIRIPQALQTWMGKSVIVPRR